MENVKFQRFLFLDGLRAVAALMVMFHHFYTLLKPFMNFQSSYLDILFDNGALGVPIFFVLSGFVIAYSVYNLQLSFSVAFRFIVRRSIRLAPPFWAALSLSFMIPIITSSLLNPSYKIDFTTFIANALYVQDFLGYDRPLAVSWTLSIELQFYLFFILLITLLRNVSSRFRIGLFLALYVLSLVQKRFGLGFWNTPGLFFPNWYSFSIGCMASWLSLKQINERLFLVTFLLLLPFLNDPLVLATFFTILLVFFAIKLNTLGFWLSSKFFQYLGERSYSIYLIHWVVGVKFIDIASRRFPSFDPFSLFIIAIAFTLACTELFYRIVERPCLFYSKSISLEKSRRSLSFNSKLENKI